MSEIKDNFVPSCKDCIRLKAPCCETHRMMMLMIAELQIIEDRKNRERVSTYRPFDGLRKEVA